MDLKSQISRKRLLKNDVTLEALRDQGFDGSFDPTIDRDALFNERDIFKKRWQQAEAVRRQETLIFSSKERESQNKVRQLQEEAIKLSSAVQNFTEELKTAAVQNIVEPGTYHVGFLEQLISFLKVLTKQVDNGANWLAVANSKSKKKSHYWGQVQKSGSKYMLSSERYMSTQAG